VGAEEVVLVGDVEVGEKVTGFEVGCSVQDRGLVRYTTTKQRKSMM
jgi:hypothetical protein